MFSITSKRLLYFTGTKCNLYFFFFLCRTSKGSGTSEVTHCTENTALVPIEENQICALFLRFFVDLHLFDKAPSSDGKWVDKLRQKRQHGLSVGSWAVSLSINDIICPPDVFVPVTLVAHELKEEGGGGGKKCLFLSLELSGWRNTGDSSSLTETETLKWTDCLTKAEKNNSNRIKFSSCPQKKDLIWSQQNH